MGMPGVLFWQDKTMHYTTKIVIFHSSSEETLSTFSPTNAFWKWIQNDVAIKVEYLPRPGLAFELLRKASDLFGKQLILSFPSLNGMIQV